MRGPMTITVYYDEVALSRWVETTVRAPGIQVVLGAVLREARLRDRRITELLLATRYGDLLISGNGIRRLDRRRGAHVACRPALSRARSADLRDADRGARTSE